MYQFLFPFASEPNQIECTKKNDIKKNHTSNTIFCLFQKCSFPKNEKEKNE